MSRRKKKLTPIKKHFLIPLSLCGVIVIAGIIMTALDQVGNRTKTYYKLGQSVFHQNSSYIITGPQTIVLGSTIGILLLIYQFKLKSGE